MRKFKSYFYLSEATFTGLSHGEWWKYGDDRLKKLMDLVKSGDAITKKDGTDVTVLNNAENIKTIQDYIDAGASGTVKKFTLKTKDGTIDSNMIGKTAVFGGKGTGGGATGDTRKGESLQCLYIAALFGEGTNQPFEHFTPAVLSKYESSIDVDAKMDEMLEAADQWHYSGYTTGKYLIKKGYVKRNHMMHRGSAVMKQIYAKKRMAFKNENRPALNDDKWNPGDIWAVKRGLNINNVLDASSVASLNQGLVKHFESRDIVGISLKIVGSLKKTVKDTVYNKEGVKPDKITFSGYKLKKDQARATFWSGKGGVFMFDKTKKADVRSSTNFAAPNFEILGKGARGGRAGYQAIQYAAKKFLNKVLPNNMNLKQQAMALVKEVKGKRSKTLQNKFYNMVRKADSRISRKEFDDGVVNATADRMHINLAAAEIGNALMKSTIGQRNDFASSIINLAAAKTSDASVYVKAEES